MGIDGFTPTKPRYFGGEEKTIPSCLDTCSPMFAPPVLQQSSFCALKITDWPKLDRFKFFDFRHILSARSESQSELMGLIGI